MSLDNLNKLAQNRFVELKSKQNWTIDRIRHLSEKSDVTMTDEKFAEMMETPKVELETKDLTFHQANREFTAKINPMDFIDGLNLSPNLSIAIANLITGYQKQNIEFYKDAIKLISQEIK